MSAAGRVLTGFSHPYVALYSVSGTTVSYTSCTALARGVNVSVTVEDAGDDNIFYADNAAAESIAGVFGGGTVTLEVDGLLDATRKLILGLPVADAAGWTDFGDSMSIPYVGIGFIARYQSEGTESYVAYVLNKCKFKVPEDKAATQEENIDWQTTTLEAELFRDDSSNHTWKSICAGETTEAAALAKLTTKLGQTQANNG